MLWCEHCSVETGPRADLGAACAPALCFCGLPLGHTARSLGFAWGLIVPCNRIKNAGINYTLIKLRDPPPPSAKLENWNGAKKEGLFSAFAGRRRAGRGAVTLGLMPAPWMMAVGCPELVAAVRFAGVFFSKTSLAWNPTPASPHTV